jgi:hypothetical protein
MEAHLQTTLQICVLAERANLSLRQLERLVQRHFSTTPRILYSLVRLNAARGASFPRKVLGEGNRLPLRFRLRSGLLSSI